MVRLTPPEEIDRINERLFRESKLQIQDRDSYDLAFNDLLNKTDEDLTSTQRSLRNVGFREFVSDHPNVSNERLFTKAKGKDLKRDRRRTAGRVVETRQEFVEAGASKVDLKGFDTARQKITRDIVRRRTFTVAGRIKGRAVFTKRTSVKVRGKKQLRFRDSRGRFASSKVK